MPNYTGNGATIRTMGNGTATTNSYYSLGLLPGVAGSQILGSNVLGSGALDVNGNLTIGDAVHTGGATASANNPAINVYGNFQRVASQCRFAQGTGTTSFKKNGTQTWTDSTAAGQDLGTVSISGSNAVVNLGSNVTASTITIGASQTLSTNGAHALESAQYMINNGGTLVRRRRPYHFVRAAGLTFTNTGTLSMTGNILNLTGVRPPRISMARAAPSE